MRRFQDFTLGVVLVLSLSACSEEQKATAMPEVATSAVPVPQAEAAPAEPEQRPAVDTAPQAADLDPCALLTIEEVTSLMGGAVNAERNGDQCRWKPASGPGSVTLNIVRKNGQEHLAQQKKFLGSDEELNGIGNQAFRSGLMYGVQVGSQYVGVVIAPNFPKPAPKPEAATELVKLAVSRLPS